MRKNLAVDIPVDAETEVQRVRGLKKSIFTRTRIALLCLVMVISLSVVGTFAYEKWSGNTVPNRTNSSDVELHIVESINGATAVSDTDGTGVELGYGKKQVYLQVGQDKNKEKNRGPEKVRVSFIPECESNDYAGANVAIDETNASGKWGEIKTEEGTNYKYISNDVLKLYITSNYDEKWDYDGDGTFTYKTSLKTDDKTEVLLQGVDFVNAADKDNYAGVKVNVIADAIQESAASQVWTTSTTS